MSEKELTKRCSKCKQIKSHSEFYKDKRHKDGLFSHCKQCHKQYAKPYQQHRAESLQAQKKYAQTHREQIQQRRKRYFKSLKGYLRVVWHNMLKRCNNPDDNRYKDYGGRGIKVKFESFDEFFDYVVNDLKADPRGLTIDRIDNDGHYEKGNIRFITHKENCQNRQRKGV